MFEKKSNPKTDSLAKVVPLPQQQRGLLHPESYPEKGLPRSQTFPGPDAAADDS